ncbi:MAG: hypothetical protein JWO82_2850, partial [Akkermansiaceae bacterium]|nr:hypothetical protein [Akkermansiaceae bacterium]
MKYYSFITSAALLGVAHSFAAEISVDAANFKNACSPLLYGACIEDVNHEIYGGLYDQRLYGESFEEPAKAVAIFGWSAYDGIWRPAGVSVAVNPVAGAKLVRDQPQFADGEVEFDLRFTSPGPASNNAGAIVRVQNAGVGADAFNGYEISLAADGSGIVLGRHQQNFALLKSAAVAVDVSQWQHLRVVLTGGRVQVYLNGGTTAVIDYVDANPLPAGSMGLRTWNSAAEFRNFKSVAGGQDVTANFQAVPASITGWPAFGGAWQPNDSSSGVAVTANQGAKIVQDQPQISDGAV